jgi:hypothetical protein
MRTRTPYLAVRDSTTGKTVETVTAPADVSFGAVYGTAADDRTFVVTGDRLHGLDAGRAWLLLRITPGTDHPVRLTSLSVQVPQLPTGVALSPDGTKLAVALPGSPAALRIFSVKNGALLGQWSTTAPGELTAEKGAAGSFVATAAVLRWSPDGRQLAFAWNAAEIRVLTAGRPGGDLLADSRTVAAIGTTFASLGDFTCEAAQGWQLLQGGQGVVCAAGGQDHPRQTHPTNESGCPSDRRLFVGFVKEVRLSGGGELGLLAAEAGCPPGQAKPEDGAYLGWASPDGGVLIGTQVWAGHERSGVFRGNRFTPLPSQPGSLAVPARVLDGTVAW